MAHLTAPRPRIRRTSILSLARRTTSRGYSALRGQRSSLRSTAPNPNFSASILRRRSLHLGGRARRRIRILFPSRLPPGLGTSRMRICRGGRVRRIIRRRIVMRVRPRGERVSRVMDIRGVIRRGDRLRIFRIISPIRVPTTPCITIRTSRGCPARNLPPATPERHSRTTPDSIRLIPSLTESAEGEGREEDR